MKNINIHSNQHNYTITINENLEFLIKKFLKSDIRYFILFDKKIPNRHQKVISRISPRSTFYLLEGGENAKTLDTYKKVVANMIKNNIAKSDVLIAFGGGTIGDLGGYIASTYKRGINWINIPTTTLSMIDSSIGGKTALNFDEIKNAIGTFYPPVKVLIGTDVVTTLDERNFNNGIFEALKIAMVANKTLFDVLYYKHAKISITDIVYLSLKTKKKFIEKDEYDTKDIRKVLNYGHTIGHAIELQDNLLHGEAIANGILCMSYGKSFYEDVKNILIGLKCPIKTTINFDKIINYINNDKKVHDYKIDLVIVDKIGKAQIKTISVTEMRGLVNHYVF